MANDLFWAETFLMRCGDFWLVVELVVQMINEVIHGCGKAGRVATAWFLLKGSQLRSLPRFFFGGT